ncbi:hypothetical protein FOCC_FOCC017520 [Frankliniella occidentalis]|nr:hypothetical protein FOCC_FOCC017520 [Frankliniella occidentalis]
MSNPLSCIRRVRVGADAPLHDRGVHGVQLQPHPRSGEGRQRDPPGPLGERLDRQHVRAQRPPRRARLHAAQQRDGSSPAHQDRGRAVLRGLGAHRHGHVLRDARRRPPPHGGRHRHVPRALAAVLRGGGQQEHPRRVECHGHGLRVDGHRGLLRDGRGHALADARLGQLRRLRHPADAADPVRHGEPRVAQGARQGRGGGQVLHVLLQRPRHGAFRKQFFAKQKVFRTAFFNNTLFLQK